MLAGVITGILHTKLKIPTARRYFNDVGPLFRQPSHHGKSKSFPAAGRYNFSLFDGYGMTMSHTILIVGILSALLFTLLMYWFFGTEIGAAIRATGYNQQMIRANGVNTDATIILGLLLSNGLVGVSGALVGQSNGFADVGMGVGTIVIGLASVIIGEVLFGTRSFKNCLVPVVLGSVVYRIVIAIVLQLGMPPNDLKLFTAILVALALSMPLFRNKWSAKKRRALSYVKN